MRTRVLSQDDSKRQEEDLTEMSVASDIQHSTSNIEGKVQAMCDVCEGSKVRLGQPLVQHCFFLAFQNFSTLLYYLYLHSLSSQKTFHLHWETFN